MLRDQRVLQAPAKPWTVAWRKWLEVDAPVSEESRWIIDHKLRQFDFTLKEIQELLDLRVNPESTCAHVRSRAKDKITDIEERT